MQLIKITFSQCIFFFFEEENLMDYPIKSAGFVFCTDWSEATIQTIWWQPLILCHCLPDVHYYSNNLSLKHKVHQHRSIHNWMWQAINSCRYIFRHSFSKPEKWHSDGTHYLRLPWSDSLDRLDNETRAAPTQSTYTKVALSSSQLGKINEHVFFTWLWKRSCCYMLHH